MGKYRLTIEAQNDLLEIALYGIEQFGLEQSLRYRDVLVDRFDAIASHPERYPTVSYLRPGYRRSVCGSHSVYYCADGDDVLVVRVLGAQDLQRHLVN